MKQKLPMFAVVLAVLLLVAAGGIWMLWDGSFGISIGRCLVTQNGSCMILLENEPIQMSNRSKNEDLFAGLQTGDEIRILHNGIQCTYPGGTGVYFCQRLREGTIADVPEDVLESLSALGWAVVDDTGLTKEIYTGLVQSFEPVHGDAGNILLTLQTESDTSYTMTVVTETELLDIDGIVPGDRVKVECTREASGYHQVRRLTEYRAVSYEYSFANMHLDLPAGWDYEIFPYDNQAYAFGIHFWPEGCLEGKLRLEFWPDEFGVCGTGLEQMEIRLANGIRVWQGTYDNRAVWDFLSTRDLPGSYVVSTENVDGWWGEYQEQAMEIVNSMTLAEGILWKAEAVHLAAQTIKTEEEPGRIFFDFCTGQWHIPFALDGIITTVSVSADGVVSNIGQEDPNVCAKPVIYLYPEEPMEVSVQLDFQGRLTSTYPAYRDGWRVLAHPDGTLTDPVTSRDYYCLFWEGISDTAYDLSSGFVVAGEDVEAFLESALSQMGLTDREANEFLIYWLPQMEGNPYNLISFQQESYTDSAVLTIDPAPDSLLRVFMVWKALEEPIELPPQELPAFERSGFTVVEWGGARLK